MRLSAADAARVLGLPRRHKYNQPPPESRTYKGIVYQSLAEARYAAELDLQLMMGQVRRWERQVRYTVTANGRVVGHYKMDFQVWYEDGRRELVEVKGKVTNEWRFRWKVFLSCWEDKLRAEGWDIVIHWVK